MSKFTPGEAQFRELSSQLSRAMDLQKAHCRHIEQLEQNACALRRRNKEVVHAFVKLSEFLSSFMRRNPEALTRFEQDTLEELIIQIRRGRGSR